MKDKNFERATWEYLHYYGFSLIPEQSQQTRIDRTATMSQPPQLPETKSTNLLTLLPELRQTILLHASDFDSKIIPIQNFITEIINAPTFFQSSTAIG